MTIKAIPTIYNGQKYRSKLEAQYAKGMDIAGIKFIYEPEGYEFEDGTKYLPDFYLPEYDCFLEVKGVMRDKDQHKIDTLRKESGKCVLVGEGGDVVVETVMPQLGEFMFWKGWFHDLYGTYVPKEEDPNEKYTKIISSELDEVVKGGMIWVKEEGYKENTNDDSKINKENLGKQYAIFLADHQNAMFMICPKCGKKTLHDACDGWSCGWCGHYDGDKFEYDLIEDHFKDIKQITITPSYIDYRSNK